MSQQLEYYTRIMAKDRIESILINHGIDLMSDDCQCDEDCDYGANHNIENHLEDTEDALVTELVDAFIEMHNNTGVITNE